LRQCLSPATAPPFPARVPIRSLTQTTRVLSASLPVVTAVLPEGSSRPEAIPGRHPEASSPAWEGSRNTDTTWKRLQYPRPKRTTQDRDMSCLPARSKLGRGLIFGVDLGPQA